MRTAIVSVIIAIGLALGDQGSTTAGEPILPSVLAPYTVDIGSGPGEAQVGAGVESVSSPGHVDFQVAFRVPASPYGPTIIADGIAFTGDIAMGIMIAISGAEVGDSWLWKYFDPSGVQVARTCDTRIVAPGEAGNPSAVDPSLVSFCDNYAIATPTAGPWEVIVDGLSVPQDGQPYLVMVTAHSEALLTLNVEHPDLLGGETQVITAAFFDGAAPVAVNSITGVVILLDASEQPLSFADDGLGADAVAGDLVYSASFSGAGLCGGYRVKAEATAATSEGTVTRQQIATFEARVLHDAVRDPCKDDEDEDGLLDDAEIDVHLTNPIDPDSDDDGLTDSQEISILSSDPTNPDTDGDGVGDAQEDSDADGCDDGPELGTDPTLGGVRDPLYFWDFFDLTGDQFIDFNDTLDILSFFGDPAMTGTPGDLRDRAATDSEQPWLVVEANDGVDLNDSLAVLGSFGHGCIGSP